MVYEPLWCCVEQAAVLPENVDGTSTPVYAEGGCHRNLQHQAFFEFQELYGECRKYWKLCWSSKFTCGHYYGVGYKYKTEILYAVK